MSDGLEALSVAEYSAQLHLVGEVRFESMCLQSAAEGGAFLVDTYHHSWAVGAGLLIAELADELPHARKTLEEQS